MKQQTLWPYVSAHRIKSAVTIGRTLIGNLTKRLKLSIVKNMRLGKGSLVSRCKKCSRPLTDQKSIVRGYGPVCYKKETERLELFLKLFDDE